MRFEPDESTLFDTDASKQPIFVIKISAVPSVIYLALLGLSVLAAIQISANPENDLLSRVYPIALMLWGIFLLLSFLSVISLFVSQIFLYPNVLRIRGVFRWGLRREIPLQTIRSVSASVAHHTRKRKVFGALHIITDRRKVVIPWVHDPESAQKAIDAARKRLQ
ncbi:MAG: hypothetical protein GXY06_05070 [Clostridiaceae bacterium]|nr:hypothetical protein [Clostridiaceae bacterium]